MQHLVTVMQFAEGLSDRQAAEAVQARIDWKYALSLEITDTGFDASVLSEFRSRLVEHEAGRVLLDALLETFKASGVLKVRGKQRTNSTHVLAAIRSLNRLECVGETLRFVLNTLSSSLPEWLQAFAPSAWYVQYGQRFEAQRLPQSKAEQVALAERIGHDGVVLVEALMSATQPLERESREALGILHRIWLQNYFYDEQGQLRWRDDESLPPSSLLLRSPYDPEARAGKKRTTTWIGYKVHLTETCDADAPHLIVHVDTTPATVADYQMVDAIHTALQSAQMMPETHLVDGGYIAALNLLTSQQVYQVNLLGPATPDRQWQARQQTGYDQRQFRIDWQTQTAHCPQGKTSISWREAMTRHGDPTLVIRFSSKDCQICPVRALCTHDRVHGRKLSVRPQAEYEVLQRRRREQATDAFKVAYRLRAGVEGTISQGVRIADLRRSRYIGLAKTSLQHLIAAAALNLIRVIEWFADPHFAQTRVSRFARLAPAY